MNTTEWIFSAVDSWFFRESRPMDSLGNNVLDSVFPPPSRTMIGAIRTAMGNARIDATPDVSWGSYRDACEAGTPHVLIDEIGKPDDMGPLAFEGPWLLRRSNDQYERLYPAPAHLWGAREGESWTFVCLGLGDPIVCDTAPEGQRFLCAPPANPAYKPLPTAWLSADVFQTVMKGVAPDGTAVGTGVFFLDDLVLRESRLGIARNNATGKVKDGQLYQTRHLRLASDIAVAMRVSSQQALAGCELAPLGGEGRMAHVVCREPCLTAPKSPNPGNATQGIVLTLLSHLESACLPTVWREGRGEVTVAGIPLTLEGLAMPDMQRIGGWSLVAGASIEVKSYFPPGTTWFVSTDQKAKTVVDALAASPWLVESDSQPRRMGQGQIACGVWPTIK